MCCRRATRVCLLTTAASAAVLSCLQVSAMLSKSPAARPSMSAVLGHPFWWSEEQRLAFLVDVSDR
jgi:hypothetical protein